MLKRVNEGKTDSRLTAAALPHVRIADAAFPAPFRSGLEYSSPARGTWNIVHTCMLVPQAHLIYVCAAGCLRGVVLTAAEMGAMDRFSTIAIREHNLLDGDMEDLIIEGVTDIIGKLPKRPPAVMLHTSCVHHFQGTDLDVVYRELRSRFPDIDFTDCYMNPIMRKSGLTPDQLMRSRIYMLLHEQPAAEDAVAIVGSDMPTDRESDLMQLLRAAGLRVHEITSCKNYTEYQQMAEAKAFISFYPDAAPGADMLAERLGRPHYKLKFSFDYDEIDETFSSLAELLSKSKTTAGHSSDSTPENSPGHSSNILPESSYENMSNESINKGSKINVDKTAADVTERSKINDNETAAAATEGGRINVDKTAAATAGSTSASIGITEINRGTKSCAPDLALRPEWFEMKRAECEEALAETKILIGTTPIVIDYTYCPRPFGLAKLLLDHGFNVTKVYADSIPGGDKADFEYLQTACPELLIYPTVHASMRFANTANRHDTVKAAESTSATTSVTTTTITSGTDAAAPGNSSCSRSKSKSKCHVLAIGQKAAYFENTDYFVNIVEGGGMIGYEAITRTCSLMREAYLNKKEMRELVQVKGLGCEVCIR